VTWQVAGASPVDVTAMRVGVPSLAIAPLDFEFVAPAGVIDQSFFLCFADYTQFADQEATFQLVDAANGQSNVVTSVLPTIVDECLTDNGGCGDPTEVSCTHNPGARPTCAPIGGVPPAWTCDPDLYGVADGCDCGCGVVDLDCVDATLASCEFNSCAPGFETNPEDATTCRDIDECAVDNGGCGDPAFVDCIDNTASAPTCIPLPPEGTCDLTGFSAGTLEATASYAAEPALDDGTFCPDEGLRKLYFATAVVIGGAFGTPDAEGNYAIEEGQVAIATSSLANGDVVSCSSLPFAFVNAFVPEETVVVCPICTLNDDTITDLGIQVTDLDGEQTLAVCATAE
jgi:hypothetical protein